MSFSCKLKIDQEGLIEMFQVGKIVRRLLFLSQKQSKRVNILA